MFVKDESEYSRCPVCVHSHTSGLDSFCHSHRLALDNILRGYAEWIRGYGSLAKEEYLLLLSKNSSAGEWVIEVAEYLLREGLAEWLGDTFAKGSE